jgi:hypothetical protein
MSDKDLSLARPMQEKKACCEKFNFLRLIDVKSTAILSALLLVWIVSFILLIWHVFLPGSDKENAACDVIYITNETSRLAEEKWKLEGGPSPQDRWRQEQEAKKLEEVRQRIILAELLQDISDAPVTFSKPAERPSRKLHEIYRTVAQKNTAGEGIPDLEDEKVDISIKRGMESLFDHYAIENETLKANLYSMVKLYNFADGTIGFAGIWLVLSLGGLVICVLIKWLFFGLFRYLANRLF